MEMIGQFRWQDGVDIGIITFLIYRLLQILRGSRAMQMIIGLAVILVAYVSSRALGLFTLNWIIDNFLGSIILVIIVIFQSDIRRALTQVGTAPLFGAAERMVQRREDIIEEVAQAAIDLAAKRVGGLIVLQREVGLNESVLGKDRLTRGKQHRTQGRCAGYSRGTLARRTSGHRTGSGSASGISQHTFGSHGCG